MTSLLEKNKRSTERFHVEMKIEFLLPDNSQRFGVVRNLNTGGMLVSLDTMEILSVGEMMVINSISENGDAVALANNTVVVVHHCETGTGLAFVDMDLDEF